MVGKPKPTPKRTGSTEGSRSRIHGRRCRDVGASLCSCWSRYGSDCRSADEADEPMRPMKSGGGTPKTRMNIPEFLSFPFAFRNDEGSRAGGLAGMFAIW